MATLLLGHVGPRVLLLTFQGPRPLLLGCAPELMQRAAPPAEVAAPAPPPEPLRRVVPARDPDRVWQDESPPPAERPRAPEVAIDPRTVFKRRGAPPATFGVVRERSSEAVGAAEGPTHDFVIVPGNPAFRASEQGVKALITYLRTAQILAAKAQKITEQGTTIELLPDVFSHLAFMEGQAPQGLPSVLEGTVWFGPKAVALPYGDGTRMAAFRLELVGARFSRLAEAFVARMHQILYLRPEVLSAAHDPARLRGPAPKIAAEPIPRFDMQER